MMITVNYYRSPCEIEPQGWFCLLNLAAYRSLFIFYLPHPFSPILFLSFFYDNNFYLVSAGCGLLPGG